MTGAAVAMLTLSLDVVLIVLMMLALSWRESRWSRAPATRRSDLPRPAVRARETSRAKAA